MPFLLSGIPVENLVTLICNLDESGLWYSLFRLNWSLIARIGRKDQMLHSLGLRSWSFGDCFVLQCLVISFSNHRRSLSAPLRSLSVYCPPSFSTGWSCGFQFCLTPTLHGATALHLGKAPDAWNILGSRLQHTAQHLSNTHRGVGRGV